MVISREDRMLIKVLRQEKRYGSETLLAEACLSLNNSWRQPLVGATDRGVVRLGSQHYLCGSESVGTRLWAYVRADGGHFERQL